MKLRNILISVVAMGMMFASSNTADVLGYSAGDYSDMNTFAHKANGSNVAWTDGTGFTAMWTADGTTWGFEGADDADLVNMWWASGNYGVNVGVNMPPEDDGDMSFAIGFGTSFSGWDIGLNMSTAEDSDMMLNARGNCEFWAFDTFTFAYNGYGADGDDAAYTTMNFGAYGTADWGPATGMFGLGLMTNDDASYDDGYTAINTNFSVKTSMTDYITLYVGYGTWFNMGDNSHGDEYRVGLGFDYGDITLDMTLSDGVLNDMVSNPVHYLSGRNDGPLAASWTISYNW